MGKNKENESGSTTSEQISKSKQKRIEREKKNKKEKRESFILRIIGIVILLIIALFVVYLVVQGVERAINSVTASNDYSALLDENGYINGVNANDCLDLCEYKGVTVSSGEITYTDEEVEQDIETALESHEELSSETTALIKDGDKINLDYVGTIDGVEFDGGNTNGEGSDLTIGSGTFIDDFEQQLIGYGVGDNVTVSVTFPEDYSSEELQGKDAIFECTINGIYEVPEFNDDFVAEYYSDDASTAKEYRQFIKDSKSKEKFEAWAANYLKDNTEVKNYPKNYLKNLKQVHKYTEIETFGYMSQMYASMYGMDEMDFYKDYMGMSEAEYDESLNETCKETEKENLIYQAIMEKEGIKLTVDDYKAKLEEDEGSEDSFDNEKETYGENYLVQTMYKDKALEILMDNAVVTD